jgi:hypothetical protein
MPQNVFCGKRKSNVAPMVRVFAKAALFLKPRVRVLRTATLGCGVQPLRGIPIKITWALRAA